MVVVVIRVGVHQQRLVGRRQVGQDRTFGSGRAGRALGRSRTSGGRVLLAAVVSGFAALAVSGFAEYMWYYPRCLFACFLFLGVAMAALRIEETAHITA